MKTITVTEAANRLGVSPYSIFTYLSSGRLDGDAQAGLVDTDSLCAYRVKITPHHAEITQVLAGDFELTDRERDILERRARFEKLHEIGDAHGIKKSRVSAIIRRLLRKHLDE